MALYLVIHSHAYCFLIPAGPNAMPLRRTSCGSGGSTAPVILCLISTYNLIDYPRMRFIFSFRRPQSPVRCG